MRCKPGITRIELEKLICCEVMGRTLQFYMEDGRVLESMGKLDDLKEQLSGLDLGEKLLIPCSMLKGDEEIFLDDMTLKELSEALKTEIVIVDTGGRDLVEAVINPPKHKPTRRRQIYEQTSSSDSGKA